ncbi:MAG: LacI family DNA-binding transcriptional regulator [Candidatus Latescibacteria bacterium]|nr:LacI family DNA-binding transcriptional regulator [Candidatus Latescibacterota bacterium]
MAEKTRKRVQQLATELDYSPNLMAQGFVTGRTSTLGLLTYQIFIETFGRQTDQILRAADKQKYLILMMAPNQLRGLTPEDQTTQIKQLLSRGIDGLLIHTRGDRGESERILNVVRGRVPVVTFTHPIQNLNGVVVEEIASFCEATEHLIRLGHERIGFIGPDWNKNFAGSAKGKGYLLAMQKHGLTPKRISDKTLPAKPTHRLGKKLGDPFTALVCRNDYTAIGACRGLREAGFRVPDDVAVVGYGDLEVGAYVTPALTTSAIPYEVIAEAAMALILEQLEGQDEPRQVALKSTLVVRESCGANSSKK